MSKILPIETLYNGHRFRSRLESRYAVLLDALGIDWHYEAQGYSVDGLSYLPDFWLPSIAYHAEVKPDGALTPSELAKMRAFNANPPTGSKGLIQLVGMPDVKSPGVITLCHYAVIRNKRHIEDAVNTARYARFEHGETPVIARKTYREGGRFNRLIRALIYALEG